VNVPDETTKRLQSLPLTWRDVAALSDTDLAAPIDRDRIDLLIECNGHTARNRLLALAGKPAPVMVSFLGYPDTTGMRQFDYRLTDSIADPPGAADELHVEKLMRLDPCAWCYQPPAAAPDLPQSNAGRPITFGSFNKLNKLTPRWIRVWAKILRQVPGSQLLLKNALIADPQTRARVLGVFAQHGFDAGRVITMGKLRSIAEHLATYAQIDVALDTFPYHGTTTTCEALFMGVPVVSRAGQTHHSRVGASLLSAVGLAHLLAATDEQYVEIAIALAANRPQRATIRRQMQASPLMDAAGYTTRLEAAYHKMWQLWRR
jgi:protein O-GlcNAc transferase